MEFKPVKNAEEARQVAIQYAKTWKKKLCENLVNRALEEISSKASMGGGDAWIKLKDGESKVSDLFSQEMEDLGFSVQLGQETIKISWLDITQCTWS